MPAGFPRVRGWCSRCTTRPTAPGKQDLTKIGLIFGERQDITHEVSTLTALNHDFEIPPGHPDYPVSAGISRLPAKGEILAITPHMHYRGKSFRVFAERGEETEILLDVPRYDFNWQHIYELAEPLPLKSITKLRFTARFDNSAANPFNPDPARHVTWGDQTWEEMAIGFFQIAVPRGTKVDRFHKPQTTPQDSPERRQKIQAFVDRFFKRFDANGDGVILKTELPARPTALRLSPIRSEWRQPRRTE